MPELPEVEVLVRHLAPVLQGRTIQSVHVRRAQIVAPQKPAAFARALRGCSFRSVTRRGKYLLFKLNRPHSKPDPVLVGHLGMTGRMYLLPVSAPLPKHAAVAMTLDRHCFVFEDTRYFGRLTLDADRLETLGPEPLDESFSPATLANELKRSAQAIKVKLLDQSLVAGIGNIYASEALFRAGISPRARARRLTAAQVHALWKAIRAVLREAIRFGSTVPLDWTGRERGDGLFYYGRAAEATDYYEERLRVYDRAGQPCSRCGASIRRIVQAARSTFYCPRCQH